MKVDHNGLQFFYEQVLRRPWLWVDIVKPPQVRALPDILTLKEIERLINGTRELRYQTFILVAFSMGLRLGEVLNLQVGDIDSGRMKMHIRRGKGINNRLVRLPQLALETLRRYWKSHRHSRWIFPMDALPRSPVQPRTSWIAAVCRSPSSHRHKLWHSQARDAARAAPLLRRVVGRGRRQPAWHSTRDGVRVA